MAYRRRSEEEIQAIKKARLREAYRPTTPLGVALISAGLIFVFLSYFQGRLSAPLGFSKTSLLIALASGLGIFVFLYVMQILTTKDAVRSSETFICSRCLRPHDSGHGRCACGGDLEPIAYYVQDDE